AEVDMNVVMTGRGHYVELQGTAEAAPLQPDQLQDLLALASKGIGELIALQKECLGDLNLVIEGKRDGDI
ncbi:MAG: ribonuclease PH, partial [bacterium]